MQSPLQSNAPSAPPGISVGVRRGRSGATEEFTVLSGAARYAAARGAIARRAYDGVILMRAGTDGAIARTWAPLAMRYHGDGASLCAAGRAREPHIRARGVLNELALLWRCTRARMVPLGTVLRDAVRLTARFVRLMAHECGVFIDDDVDNAAEVELLAGSVVPVAVIGGGGGRFRREGRDVFVVGRGETIDAFLQRCAHFVREGSTTPKHRRVGSNASAGHVALPLPF